MSCSLILFFLLLLAEDEIVQLRNKVNDLKQLIEDTMYASAETTFTFQVDAILDFFKSNNERYSRLFYAQSVPWSILVKYVKKDDEPAVKFLQVFLVPKNEEDRNRNFSCKVNYELRLLSSLPSVQSKTKMVNHTFTDLIGIPKIDLSHYLNHYLSHYLNHYLSHYLNHYLNHYLSH